MHNPRLASRYAKSLIELAQEQGRLEEVYSDMLVMQSIVQCSKEFLNLLRSPIIKPDKKVKIINAVTEGKISNITTSFNRLLVIKNREAIMSEIITAFIKQYKELKNIHPVKLTTAMPVSDALKNAIIAQIKKTSDLQNIELETCTNEDLIGGFTLQAGDKLVDASVATQLKDIARQFKSNDFVYRVR